jgi:hypothetical protein
VVAAALQPRPAPSIELQLVASVELLPVVAAALQPRPTRATELQRVASLELLRMPRGRRPLQPRRARGKELLLVVAPVGAGAGSQDLAI